MKGLENVDFSTASFFADGWRDFINHRLLLSGLSARENRQVFVLLRR
jgi:hypothetical protein